ncbi:MAG: autotransporter domain-containing protein, partial [Parvibaculum sp.]|nr:autotransporter domain-containing protein [Parvibaculum sp.]
TESNEVSIYNYGTATGDIVVSTDLYADTYILHTGSLTGDIDISEGGSSDTIIVDGGTITGAIFTGDGTDDVTVQGEGVEITEGIHAGDEGSADLTFAQSDTITFSEGIEGYAVSNFDTVLFSSGTTVFDGIGIHTDEGSVSVSGDATLATTGEGAYIIADSLEVDGILSIAQGGWFDVSGSVDFGEGSTFLTGLSSEGAGVVYGDTIFFSEDSTIYAEVTGGLASVVGDDFLIASASSEGGVTDEGAAVEDNTILYRFRKVMDDEIVTSGSADDLYLRIEIDETALETETNASGGRNLTQIADAIDQYIATQPIGSPLVLYLSQFETNEEQRAALLEVIRDTLPEETNGSGETTIASTDLIFDMIMDRLSGGGFTIADSGADTGLSAGDVPLGGDGKWALWGRIGGSTAEYTPSGVNGFDADTWGGTIGIDGEVAPDTRLGLGVFYTSSSIDENGAGANSTNDIDGTGAVAYMSYRPGAWYLNASLGYGMNSYDSQRRSLGGVNVADYDGTQFVARAEVGYMFVSGQWDLTPNLGLRYNLVDVDDYTETGPLPISVNSQTTESLRAVAGVNARYTMTLEGGGRLIPELGVKILTELADPNDALTGAVVGGGAFTTQTTPRDDVSYGIGGGLTYEASESVTFRVTFDGEFQSDYTEQTLAAAVRFAF